MLVNKVETVPNAIKTVVECSGSTTSFEQIN